MITGNHGQAGPPASGRPGLLAGAAVRAARLGAGLTLAQLGQLCGYSASQVSRYERGVQPLTDVTVLRGFADALAIPPQALGLAAAPVRRHAGEAGSCPGCGHRLRVSGEHEAEDGDDPVRRRDLLAHAAGLTGAAALGWHPAAGLTLERLLYGDQAARPLALAGLQAATAQAKGDFQTARYDRLAVRLPGLISAATATRDGAASHTRPAACACLADAYIVAASLMVKLNDDALAWTLADRALQAAGGGDDPLTVADARRAVATVLRRTGRRASAGGLLARAARDIKPGPHAGPDQVSMYGTLLEVAAYTAAVDGNRGAATELITEAQAAARRVGPGANHRHTAFGPANVTLYQVSIAQVLGDNGTAIEHARKLSPATIPTAERRGRYWIDVARAYHQWGKPESCYRALLAAEHAAPGEVRYRPPVHRITEDLLHADRRRALPGLAGFARRIGVPA
jgi:transcriptional regulator with XRE-family HTH domain